MLPDCFAVLNADKLYLAPVTVVAERERERGGKGKGEEKDTETEGGERT